MPLHLTSSGETACLVRKAFMVFMHVVCFAKDVTSVHINSESHYSKITCLLLTLNLYLQAQAHASVQKCVLSQNACLLLTLILYLQAQAHTSIQKGIIHKTPACCSPWFCTCKRNTQLQCYEMNLNVSLRIMPAADSPQQNRIKEAQENEMTNWNRFFTHNMTFEEDAGCLCLF